MLAVLYLLGPLWGILCLHLSCSDVLVPPCCKVKEPEHPPTRSLGGHLEINMLAAEMGREGNPTSKAISQ